VSSGVEVEVLRRVGGLMERGLRELADSAELDDGAVKIEGPPDVSHAQRCVVKLLNRQGCHAPGKLIQGVDGDTTPVSDFLGKVTPKVAGAFVLAVGVVAVLLRSNAPTA
jgi:hypothetical protein